MLYRCILAKWAEEKFPGKRRVYEGKLSDAAVEKLNADGYNIYFLPNYPKAFEPGTKIDGSMVDTFEYVFVDFDLKSGTYADKDSFISACDIAPTRVVDSGNGVHVYWRVSDLDAMSYLRLSRRMMRKLKTDPAVGQLYQLMRAPGSVNVKSPGDFKLCETLFEDDSIAYTSEELDKLLPPISPEDEAHCKQHYDKTYGLNQEVAITDKLPDRFATFLRDNPEVKAIWSGDVPDRSAGDFRLGHLMFSAGFSREEALSVLINTSKAKDRAPQHRISYATGIVDKVYTFNPTAKEDAASPLSTSVRDILQRKGDTLKGTRFPCWSYLDATEHGFRLGQVIGLVAGSGVGKTALAIEMFYGFVHHNPDYTHLFIPLEQPAEEIADRWRKRCGDSTHLHDLVHVMSNYDEKGGFRHLSLSEIKDYILAFQASTKRKIGCVVIDHIGALRKKGKNGENQDLMDICHSMKAFAVGTNTMLIMQSQAPREKAGIGDLELNKDAAYGTVYFESYCDYLITMWQPLKRCYNEPECPTITAFKFCKIRHKHREKDLLQEDTPYVLNFNPNSEAFSELTQVDMTRLDFWNKKATNLRARDRKTDLVIYTNIEWSGGKNGAGLQTNRPDVSGNRKSS